MAENRKSILLACTATLVVLAGLSACEKVYDDGLADFQLRTHLSSYQLGDTIRLTIENPTNSAVYYRRCGAQSFRYAIYKVSGSDTLTLRGDVCQSFNQTMLEVPRKSEMELVFRLNINPPPNFDVPGEYFIELRMIDVMNRAVEAPRNHTNRFMLAQP